MFDPDIETLAPARLRKLQNQKLQGLLDRLKRSDFYQRRFSEAGLSVERIRSVEDLALAPFTRKSDLRDHYPFGLFGVERTSVARLHVSSGTTGKPTVVGYTAADLQVFAEVVARSLSAAGLSPGMTLHNAYGYGLFTGGLGLHYGAEKLGMTVIPASGGVTERQILLITDFQPEAISCTPSYAQTLADAFRGRGISAADISLQFAVLGAEPWSEAIREDVEQGLGVSASNIYGLSEVMGPGVSQECLEGRNGSHVWEDHFFPEIVDPSSGEPLPDGREGVVVFTTLSKQCLPLLRYWSADICSLHREPCRCGRTHVRMGPVKGRADDMLIVRGVNLYPGQIEDLLREFEPTAPHYQLIVRRPGTLDEVELRLEITQEFFQKVSSDLRPEFATMPDLTPLRSALEEKIRGTLGLRLQITLLPPGRVPRSEGGKLNRFVDERRK